MKTVYEWKRKGLGKVCLFGEVLEASVYGVIIGTEANRSERQYYEAIVNCLRDGDYQEFDTEAEAIAWCEAEITGKLEAAGLKLASDPSPA